MYFHFFFLFFSFFSILFGSVLFEKKERDLNLNHSIDFPIQEWVLTQGLKKVTPVCFQELTARKSLLPSGERSDKCCVCSVAERVRGLVFFHKSTKPDHPHSPSQWFDRKREVYICVSSASVPAPGQLLPAPNQLNLSSADRVFS